MNFDHVPKVQRNSAFHALLAEIRRLEDRVRELERGHGQQPPTATRFCVNGVHVWVGGSPTCACGRYGMSR